MKTVVVSAMVLFTSAAVAQQFSRNVDEGMNDLRRCMTKTILQTFPRSKLSAELIVENSFGACRTELESLTATVQDEKPSINAVRLVTGMRVLMKDDYVKQINELRQPKRP